MSSKYETSICVYNFALSGIIAKIKSSVRAHTQLIYLSINPSVLCSHKLSSFCEKYDFLPAAQFAYRKGLGCTDALLTMSHHLQKSLDTGIESYTVQLGSSAAFDRVSHCDLFFKLKSIVLYI